MIVLCIVDDFVIFLRIKRSSVCRINVPSEFRVQIVIFCKMLVCDIKIIGSCLVDHIICTRNVFNRILTE